MIPYTVESRYVKLGIFLKSCFKLNAFQLNLLLLSQISMCRNSQISMCRNFWYLEVAFQSQIVRSIQIMFVMSKLFKSINKPVHCIK